MYIINNPQDQCTCSWGIPCFAPDHNVKGEGLAGKPRHAAEDALCCKVVVFVEHFLAAGIP